MRCLVWPRLRFWFLYCREMDGEGSPEEEKGGETVRGPGFLAGDQDSAPRGAHQGVISNNEELHVLHGPPSISLHLQDRQQGLEEQKSTTGSPNTAELPGKDGQEGKLRHEETRKI